MNHRDSKAVDVIVLHRPGEFPRQEILAAIQGQRDVNISLHLLEGPPRPEDRHRWVTIARARNAARKIGSSPWVMFVDDDVFLHSDCIAKLLLELQQSPRLGAIAADYSQNDRRPQRSGHVAMGATLFRREVLQRLTFRCTDQLCECWCACLDLRRTQVDIRYSTVARAQHRQQPERDRQQHSHPVAISPGDPGREVTVPKPMILAAFDRRDINRFEHQFLKTLRAQKNTQLVHAVGYGLYPTERNRLERLPQVQLDWRSYNGQMVPVRRIADFASILDGVDPHTPVAYWDVADVIFQDSLDELWQTIRSTPERLLAVIEPKGYPHNQVIPAWSMSIEDPLHRQQAFHLLQRHPFLNSGFAAGTAETMLKYFRCAVAMRQGPELTGTTDWGDQMCLNLYCHKNPGLWKPIDHRWNFCIHDRPPGEIRVTPQGRICSRSGFKISVAHGNARSLRQFSILQRNPG